jgi:hypothetical protein
MQPYLSTLISDEDYGVGLNNANVNTILSDALTFSELTVGTIGSLRAITSGDRKYDGSLSVNVREPKIVGYGFKDSNGGLWGNNAIITAELATADGTVDQVKILASGYGFNTDNDNLIFTNTTTNDTEVELISKIGIRKYIGIVLTLIGSSINTSGITCS